MTLAATVQEPVEVPRSPDLCVFSVAGTLLAVDVRLVAEVVTVDALIGIPMSPRLVLGLFNLRGTPVALLDLAHVLGLSPVPVAPPERAAMTALVVRFEDVTAAFIVERMHGVVSKGQTGWRRPSSDDHPAVSAFLTIGEAPPRTVTVLDSSAVVARISAARMQRGSLE